MKHIKCSEFYVTVIGGVTISAVIISGLHFSTF